MEIVIALVSFLTGFLAALFFALKTQQVNFINDHIPDIEFIEECAVGYWLTEPLEGFSKKEKAIYNQKIRMLEAKLRGAFNAQSLFYNEGCKLLGVENFAKYKNIFFKLENAATGGSFETDNRKADPSRATDIMFQSSELKCFLGPREKNYSLIDSAFSKLSP